MYLSGPGPTELLVVRSQFSFEVCKERKLEIKTHVVVICIFPEGVSSILTKVKIAKDIPKRFTILVG